jgi:N-acetylglutamate synthase-like GNAT family acetyltransferase
MIREAVSKDIKPLSKLFKELTTELDIEYVKSITQNNIRSYLAKDNCVVLISKDDKVINGALLGQVVTNGFNQNYKLIISALHVSDAVDKNKVADAMIRKVKTWGQQRQVNDVSVSLFSQQDYGFKEPEIKTYSIA